jgi:hypothetical protein
MSLYSLNEQQVKNLQVIVQSASIKGADAPAILEIMQALSSPINPEVIEAPKNVTPIKKGEKQ